MRLLLLFFCAIVLTAATNLGDAQAKEPVIQYGRYHNVRILDGKDTVSCRILTFQNAAIVLATTTAAAIDENVIHTTLKSHGQGRLKVKSMQRISRAPKASSAFLGTGKPCFVLSYKTATDLKKGGRP